MGSIAPRQVKPIEEIRFTYTLWPRAVAGDSGFDLLPGESKTVTLTGKQTPVLRTLAR